MRHRYGFASAYLACFVVTELAYTRLTPAAQARLIAWASTNVANLEHEPVGPLVLSTLVTPGYLVVWPVLIALACGTWPARALAAVDAAVLVFPGHIFGGLSQLDVSAVGHLTAALTAAAALALIRARRGRGSTGSGGHVADGHADQVGDRDGDGPQQQLPYRAPPERPVGQPGHDAPAGDRGDGGEAERDGHHVQAE